MFNKISILNNPYIIFILFLSISLLNLLLSTHFIPIMFAGILFLAFITTISKKYYYSLFWVMLSFMIVANTQGFSLFSLIILSFLIYIFIKPYIDQVFSSYDIVKSLYIIIFYLGIMLLYIFTNEFSMQMLTYILGNIMIDIMIVGLFI